MLAVAGRLDLRPGGPPEPLSAGNARRTLYGSVDRTNPDPGLALFDFPDSKSHAAVRDVTVGPLQRLYHMNNPFVLEQAAALADRLAGEAGYGSDARVKRAYDLLFSRPPDSSELAVAREYLASDTWERYCHALLASSEFLTMR